MEFLGGGDLMTLLIKQIY